jgi:hypothetical protein
MSRLAPLVTCALGALVLSAIPAAAQAPATQPPPPPSATPNDYAAPGNWLCRPGHRGDACDVVLETTVVTASGKTSVEPFVPAKVPAVDCFYVYPTVSRDPGIVAAMKVTAEERRVVALQFARFAQVCRPFAPLYRQFTLTALVGRMSGKPLPAAGIDPKTRIAMSSTRGTTTSRTKTAAAGSC